MNYEEAIKSAYQHHEVTDMSDIINALHYAQKEHQLLGLYRENFSIEDAYPNDKIKMKQLEEELK